jgi:hypothetical protein
MKHSTHTSSKRVQVASMPSVRLIIWIIQITYFHQYHWQDVCYNSLLNFGLMLNLLWFCHFGKHNRGSPKSITYLNMYMYYPPRGNCFYLFKYITRQRTYQSGSSYYAYETLLRQGTPHFPPYSLGTAAPLHPRDIESVEEWECLVI